MFLLLSKKYDLLVKMGQVIQDFPLNYSRNKVNPDNLE